MKKVLSLVLAFAMILGSFGFVFASDFSDVKDTEYYSEPVNVLSGLGVIAGFPDGTFKPGDDVTRAQMATMITAALGIPVKGSGATGFSDVPASHWASGYIAYAVSVGFVAGYPDKTFKPENPVSYNEALTMIVASLGYTAEALPGQWPGAFVNKARGLGILDTCKTTGNAAAPRQDIACFLYDALTAGIGYVDKDGEWHQNAGGDNMMKRLGAGLYDPDGSNDAKKAGDPFVVTGTEDAAINLQNHLGEYVTAYANKDDEIIAIAEILSTFVEGDYVDDLEDTYNFGSAKKVDYISFTNGDEDATAADYKTGEGMKLAVKLSGKTIKEVYSMQVWDAKDTFFAEDDVQEVIEDSQKLDTYSFALDDNEEIDADAFSIVGRDTINDIKEDDVVTVYLHTSGANKDKIAKIEVSDKTVEGVITKVNKGKTDSTKFTIAGTGYGINKFAKADGDVTSEDLYGLMSAETSAVFYLDYAGKIFAYDDEQGTKNYAVVLGTDYTSKFGEETYEIKLFLADGKASVFEAKKAAYDKAVEGELVEYVLNSDNVVKSITAQTAGTASPKEFTSKGVYANNTLGSNTVAFSYDKTGAKYSADSYDVIDASSLMGATFEALTYVASSGEFKAVLVTGASNTDTVYAIIADTAGENKDGAVYTVLYDGDVKDYTFKVTVDAGNIYTSGTAVKLAKLTFDSADAVTGAGYTPVTAEKAVLGDTRGSVSGSVYTDSDKQKFTLDDDVAIYVYTEDDGWVKGTTADMKGGDTTFDAIYLVDTDSTPDNEYDIVLVFKK